jgi:tRNA nucleotidyltransferase (CCA-adding enzyme)
MVDVPAVDATGLSARLRTRADTAAVLAALPDGCDCYVVGGTVRDLLLGSDPLDLDIVVDGPLAPVLEALGTPTREHGQFATATVTIGSLRCDLARAREERYARPGALPDVRPASIEHDLRRRDFTVNAMALGVSGPRAGRLLSTPAGLSDLAAGRLRVLHDRSFLDDPTRLLRLVRYGSRLGFEIEAGTRALLTGAVAGGALETLTGPRIGTELRLLAREPDPARALAGLAPLALDTAIALGFGLDGPAVARDALARLPTDGDPAALVIAVALLGMSAPARAGLLHRLGFDAARRDLIVATARLAPAIAVALRDADAPSAIAVAVGGAPLEAVALAGALGPATAATCWLQTLRSVSLSIGGADLLAAGVAPGRAVGVGLRAALQAKLDGRVDDRAGELAEALRAAADSGRAAG